VDSFRLIGIVKPTGELSDIRGGAGGKMIDALPGETQETFWGRPGGGDRDRRAAILCPVRSRVDKYRIDPSVRVIEISEIKG
jgi:hypothetical protein